MSLMLQISTVRSGIIVNHGTRTNTATYPFLSGMLFHENKICIDYYIDNVQVALHYVNLMAYEAR